MVQPGALQISRSPLVLLFFLLKNDSFSKMFGKVSLEELELKMSPTKQAFRSGTVVG
jgi:hypothetical protein